jgi:general secretion pathway protein K
MKYHVRPSRFAQRRGFALLAAMWLVVAITTIALEFGLQAHERRETTIDLAERAQAMAAAMAGIETERARFDQLMKQIQQGQTPPGIDVRHIQLSLIALLRVPDSGTVGNAKFTAQLRNGGEWLNINLMSEDMWRNFFISFNVGYDAADRLAQAIMDWRDPDDLPRPRGVERDAYIQAGALALPTNRNFTSISELRGVMGMTPELYARIAQYLSVCTSGHIDIDDAPEAVLYGVPGFTSEVVTTILGERTSIPFGGGGLRNLESRVSAAARQSLVANSAAIQQATNFSTSWEYVIVSTGWAPGGRTHVTAEARIDFFPPETKTMWRCEE